MKLLDELRAQGWAVAVHNDYRLDGKPRTFWLLTHKTGVWIKGEGSTDEIALDEARLQAEIRLRSALPDNGPFAGDFATLAEVECAHILAILRARVGNKKKTAEILGIGERTLYRKLAAYTREQLGRCTSTHDDMQCGLELGHSGEHSALMETSAPWFPKHEVTT